MKTIMIDGDERPIRPIEQKEFHIRAFLRLLAKKPEQVTKNDMKYYLQQLIDTGYGRSVIKAAVDALSDYYVDGPMQQQAI